MTRDELLSRFPNASEQFLKANTGSIPYGCLPSPLPERSPSDGSLAAKKAQDSNPAFYLVRIKSYRRRLLDTDNLTSKWHTDSLRYAGILPSDAPERCTIETRQEKVGTKAEERTEITITKTQPSP